MNYSYLNFRDCITRGPIPSESQLNALYVFLQYHRKIYVLYRPKGIALVIATAGRQNNAIAKRLYAFRPCDCVPGALDYLKIN